MPSSNRRNRRQAPIILIVFQLAGLSLVAMAISFYATEAWFKAHPKTATIPSTQPAPQVAQQQPSAPLEQPVESPDEADMLNPNAPIVVTRYRDNEIPLMLITGGTAGTRRSAVREAVEDIVQQAGARAGLNGTFFANASLRGTDNLLIGPSMCGNETGPTFSPFDKRKELIGRPLVLMAPTRTKIVPYDPQTLDDEAGIRSELPGLTDAFLGGVWLVHRGIPVTRKTIGQYGVKDAEDPRRRAFFALMADGRPCLGATTYVATSTQLSQALADIGIREAVLLDSGFSTSLVKDGKVLVTGHTAPGIPSRPVPHAVILFDSNPAPSASLAGTQPSTTTGTPSGA